MKRRTIRGDGVDLAAWGSGPPGAPPIVLVHGYPDTHEVWIDVAAQLSPRFRVVLFDVRGAGESSAPSDRGDYRMEKLTADLAAVAREIGAGKKVHLVGHDWGGIQAWDAISDPEISRLFASFTTISGPYLDHIGTLLRSPPPGGVGKMARQAAKSWYVYAIHVPGLMPLAWRKKLLNIWPDYVRESESLPSQPRISQTLYDDAVHGMELYRANIFQRILRPRPRPVNIPVQFIVPTEDRYVTPYLSEGLERLVPDLRRKVVPGGHWIMRREPQRVAGWITELIDEVEK